MAERWRIHVRGIVQGVGFRPFVYRLATELALDGFVRNSSDGVFLEIQGERREEFVSRLRGEAPALAQIDEVTVAELPAGPVAGFSILDSAEAAEAFVLVPPDIATCDNCRRDFSDPADRRYLYPFTNCTNCGPRYTIIEDIPYDRPATTMAGFRMCPACQAEYDDPSDRRFHAQPNACPVCGPSLSAPLEEARHWLRDGLVVAVKGLGGFHLACDAANDAAVRRLRERKRRSDKPFALMAPSLESVERFCLVSEADRRALEDPRRPIVVLPRRAGAAVSEAVAPGNRTLGVMLPYTPLHHLLFEDGAFEALVMTSGNLSEEPIVSREEELPRLAPLADRVLSHNRPIRTRVDDSVVRTFAGIPRVLRRSRGYAPFPIDLGFEVTELLACGGELKSTFCLTRQRYALLSQHIGDLENFETLEFFRETLEHMQRFFRVTPRAVAYDLHPRYLSTRLALEIPDLPHIGVQHHHAHAASCMAENRLRGRVIGVAFDGTGYGTDGQIWGGEFLVCDYAGFERRAHLRYVPLAGGDAAVRQPWRSALSYLGDVFGSQAPEPLVHAPEAQRRVVAGMIARGVNTVNTSSCGRLFDAVASILDLRHETNYEGQAAIELEAAADESAAGRYGFEVAGEELDFRPMIAEIAREALDGVPAAVISGRFHRTLADAIVAVCARIRAEVQLNRVCLSGGTFQNLLLLGQTVEGLRGCGFEVFLHSRVPPNDGGLALGQAVIADAQLKTTACA